MKNYINIAKRAYHNILMIPDLIAKLDDANAKIAELSRKNEELKILLEKQNEKGEELFARIEATLKQEFNRLHDNINESRNSLWWKADDRTSAILGETALMQKFAEIRFWQQYRMAEESDTESRVRFFSSLPKATGGLRLLQRGNALLLKKLSEICDKNGFPYWLQSGTLLGAVRHKGFVPWDDDTDCAMFRSDIEKLRELLKDDSHFQITLIYDWWAKSRQIRFRPRDLTIPCFVDIYIYDFCGEGSDSYWEKQKRKREEIVRTIENDTSEAVTFWREHPYIDDKAEQAPYLEALFKKLTECDANEFEQAESERKAPAVCWGLDNFSVGWKRLFDWDFLFPTVLLEYEGEKYNAPHEFMAYVERQYGDIWELPHDLISHFHHVSHEELKTAAMREKLRAFIESNDR